ncbi:sugar phosphate isomerase/epimerase [Microbacterium betulae]|uniref:Sugar phosphate isomerase/epimerase n=1 Tax=Microbacterium betulae TaxID=2981139 RepID=A0AA97FIP3_9MICO|nr:sugar phosphate isomerase/epimerase [Microbacterium sp. AB]WOF23344.1 sugar phosphate isomerase/epimerase [Microbacterium sp. AB]
MSAAPAIALQLYSLRDAVAQDAAATLARVAEIGFDQVELYNIVEWRSLLESGLAANGLAAPTAHAVLSSGEPETFFEAAQALGVKTLIDPFIAAERWQSRDEVLRVADELAGHADAAKAYGLSFGYHNHFWEVEGRLDGETALEVLAGALPDEVVLEVDAYWAAVGGADVPALLSSLGPRVRFLHIKDAPLVDGALSKDREDQLPAGQGDIDWPPVLAAAPQAELLVVEFDEYRGDIFEGIAQGLAGTRALLGA